jgi:hypothetical protein
VLETITGVICTTESDSSFSQQNDTIAKSMAKSLAVKREQLDNKSNKRTWLIGLACKDPILQNQLTTMCGGFR